MKHQVFHKLITNYLIFGDLHGRFKEMKKICEMFPNSIPVAAGDLMDRGPDSKKVLDYLMKHGLAILGNHDHMMIDFYRNKDFYVKWCWFWNGAMETLLSFCTTKEDKVLITQYCEEILKLEEDRKDMPEAIHLKMTNEIIALTVKVREIMHRIIEEKYIIYLESLPQFIETPEFIITHAPINPSMPFKKYLKVGLKNSRMSDHISLWNRGSIRPRKNQVQFFGHNAHRKARIYTQDGVTYAINLDSSKGEQLTAYDGPSDTLVSVPWIND